MTVLDLTRPGPGWGIRGLDRGSGSPPSPPAPALVKGLLTKAQSDVLARYAEACAAHDASRAVGARLRSELDRSRQDDALAADEAVAEGLGTAPLSVEPERLAAMEAQGRHSDACLRAVADQLGAVYDALCAPAELLRMLGLAWSEVAEAKPEPATVRRLVERLSWVLYLPSGLTPTSVPRAVRDIETLPAVGFADHLVPVLDQLGAEVAERTAQLAELAEL